MKTEFTSRRSFIRKALAATATLSLTGSSWGRSWVSDEDYESKPWIELSEAAYLHNAAQISQMAGGKPIVAVLKNNAYGLGVGEVSRLLDSSPHIFTMAVVKDENALTMREVGVTKPILLMGDFDSGLSDSLIRKNITLSVHSRSSLDKIIELSRRYDTQVSVAIYMDTGLGRMGIPYQQTLEIVDEIRKIPTLKIEQTFSTLTTPKDFATEQISRFQKITDQLEANGVHVGVKHLAPSYSLLDLPSSHQDAVRPGILLHGSFPSSNMTEAQKYPLKVAYRLKAAVIRVEKLKSGDTIGFSRFYKVKQDEWIATLPVGWADGYYSGAENGALVMLGDQLFPVVNVNASHTNISLGTHTQIRIGDVATLIGPERPEITPDGFGKLTDGHNYLQINYKESLAKHVYKTF